MTKDNEDALRCADELMADCEMDWLLEIGLDQAAGHLRRLVRENEFLSRALAARNIEVVHAAQQLNAKDALLRQAVEALECLSEHGHRCNRCDSEVDEGGRLIAAIRKHLEGR